MIVCLTGASPVDYGAVYDRVQTGDRGLETEPPHAQPEQKERASERMSGSAYACVPSFDLA